MSYWRNILETYPPAKNDRTILKFTAAGAALSVLTFVLMLFVPLHRRSWPAFLELALMLVALGLIIAGPVVKYRRFKDDPGFQAFRAGKRARVGRRWR